MEPRGLSIQEAHQQLATRQLSCKELVQSVLDAIDTLNPTLNAFVRLADLDALIAEADSRDTRGIDRERPLDGIPIGLKDNFATNGLATAAGSRILEGWVPSQDAASVIALKHAGAIVIGKLNMHEFADGPTNDNPHTGRPLNPWDVSRTPGGSSGGSAVALAADMCLGATGSDTGGSIRTPAALTGVVGLKPTYGLVPRTGVVPLSFTLDHAGPMGRTVGDVALLLQAMAGQDPADPVSLNRSFALPGDWDGDIRAMVIGVETSYTTSLLDAGVRAIFDRSLQTLESQGATVVDIEIPPLEAALAAETTILFSEALSLHRDLLASRLHDYSRDVMISLLSGAYYTGEDYVAAQRYRTHLRRALDDCFTSVDVLAMPTVVMPAPPWGYDRFEVGGQSLDVLNGFIRLTAPFNLSGHPALSVPAGLTEDGLPVGIQFAAGHLREDVLFRVGAAIERSIGRLRPPHAASA